MKTEPRLKFTPEERNMPELVQSIRKVKKAEAKADEAQAKIPKKTVKERVVDPKTGKTTTRLSFEEKKPPSKLIHHLESVPGNTVSGTVHRHVAKYEDDNVGVEAAHKLESGVEAGGHFIRSSRYSAKLRPYKRAAAAERNVEKANLAALYKKGELEQPTSNPASRMRQRQAIKRQYAAAKSGKTVYTAEQTAASAKTAAETVSDGVKRTMEFAGRHKKTFGIVIGILAAVVVMLYAFTSCSTMLGGISSIVASTTYPSDDADMLGAEAAYCALEDNLQSYLDNYETTHSYDEYHYELDDIEHDPYVLISLLTALHGGAWTLDDIGDTLDLLFSQQYVLTETVTEETRTDTDGETGEEDEYTYYICNVKLENVGLSHLTATVLSEDQLRVYALYMSTLGNREDLFPGSEYIGRYSGDYTVYDIPPEALADEQFAAMIKEAEKYLGYPYVWGGSSPSTSFDCSGFVCWVINNCGQGWNVGRTTAQGLYNICTPVSAANAKPGDLVFFEGTYATTEMSHVGIYVGNGMMLHCGDPISYTNLNSAYWQAHIAGYGRIS